MTTAEIEVYADIGGISGPDLNIKVLLRNKVCPTFMHDVGYTSWRRVVSPLAISGAAQSYVLPNDVEMVESVGITGGYDKGMQYIGEDPEKVAVAESSPAAAKPTGYYLDYDASTGEQNKIKFNTTPDAPYSILIIYYRTTYFADLTTPVEMNKYVPRSYQWALVDGLVKEICFHRFGIGDPRYLAAEKNYGMFVERATDNKERARRNNPVFSH